MIHPAPDLAAAKAHATATLGVEPYLDTESYVGYSVGGYEVALDPNGDPHLGPITHWGVPNAFLALQRLIQFGAVAHGPVQDVGHGILVATITLPALIGRIGIIENPHFPSERSRAERAEASAHP